MMHAAMLLCVSQTSWVMMLQVFFAIVLGAVGLTQAQMAFPDVAKASGASKRVFSVIDRQPLIQDPPDGEVIPRVSLLAIGSTNQSCCFQ